MLEKVERCQCGAEIVYPTSTEVSDGGSGNAEKPCARKVWIVHEIEVDRYADRVKFHGIATSEEERERLSRRNPDATVTEIEPDTDVTEYGAESFHETPSW